MANTEDYTLKINLRSEVDDSYDIIFGNDLFPTIADYLKTTENRCAIITDDNVRKLHASKLENALQDAGLNVNTFSFPAGETNKNINTCMRIMGEMSKLKYGRDSVILALGGGVVGDMAGFIAAIFNRGVPYVQIPTTVLAQADSSVGGKTAVDTSYGKNLIGAFKQPLRVFIDVSTLQTLDDREFRNGLAETIKHGVILDADFFGYLENNLGKILMREAQFSLNMARVNCKIKGKVVAADPYEKNIRKVLNYGHTVGHAIEKLAEFKLPHGHCVSIGMMVAGRVARDLRYFSQNELDRQEDLLHRAGLPLNIPYEISNESIIELTSRDKKAKKGMARYCLPVKIGEMHTFEGSYASPVDNKIVLQALDATRPIV